MLSMERIVNQDEKFDSEVRSVDNILYLLRGSRCRWIDLDPSWNNRKKVC